MQGSTQEERTTITYLRSPTAIRERCQQVLELALAGRLQHWVYHPDKLPEAAAYVAAVTRQAYPTLAIPYHSRWRHFSVGGVDRVAQLDQRLVALERAERARCHIDLVITSVLLDAGAGEHWYYHETATGQTYARSEGLAVASLHAFCAGLFSSQRDRPWQADAVGLQRVTAATLGEALQVTRQSPLPGLDGRAALLCALGAAVQDAPQYFGAALPRLGNLYDYLCPQATHGVLQARQILAAVLDSLGPIWPGRLTVGGVNLGDVWRHSQVAGGGLSVGLVPLHKLSQWLTYSLIEPLEAAGMPVTGVEALTGLAEYRNGGLFIDLGVLTPRHDAVLGEMHTPDTEVIVEWRALTVALLDLLAHHVRHLLGVAAPDLPLAKVLEGGTWRAGRQAAHERRADGRPPLQIVSDGTVF